jgi:N-acetylmuramoyl-L-alanine amidase
VPGTPHDLLPLDSSMTTNPTPRNRHRLARRILVVGAAALVAAAAAGVLLVPPAAPAGSSSGTVALPRPPIVWKPIPYGSRRQAEMAAYSARHYGVRRARLSPRMVVEHVTASTTFSSAFWTFHADRPSPELGELPGVCAHFIVDTDGTIYQLVRLDLRCRHTTGLNQHAIGVEHVGLSHDAVLQNARQLRASLALTAWLAQRFRIPLAGVIGHNESLEHPLRHERYAAWRCQTHADFSRPAMDVFRRRLRPLLRKADLPVAPTRWRDSPCR